MSFEYLQIEHAGDVYTVVENAYITLLDDEAVYTALAVCKGVTWRIYWQIVNDDCEDESNACDWTDPYKIVRY